MRPCWSLVVAIVVVVLAAAIGVGVAVVGATVVGDVGVGDIVVGAVVVGSIGMGAVVVCGSRMCTMATTMEAVGGRHLHYQVKIVGLTSIYQLTAAALAEQ